MFATVLNQNNKPLKNQRESIYPFVFLGMFAFTLSLLGILALVFYIQFVNHRSIDLTNVSDLFHSMIEKTLTENNLEYSLFNPPRTVRVDRKQFNYKEYLITISDSQNLDKIIYGLKESFFKIGLTSKLGKSDENLTCLSVYYSDLEISKIYFQYKKKGEDFSYSNILRNIVADTKVFFKNILPESEIIESLARLETDSKTTWPSKTITVFSSNIPYGELFSKYEAFITSKYPSLNLEIRKNSENIEIHYNSRKILSVLITNNVFDRSKINTSYVSVSIPEFYVYFPKDKDVQESLIECSSNNKDNLTDSLDLNEFPDSKELLLNSYSTNDTNLNDDNDTSMQDVAKVAIILDDGGYRDPDNDPAFELPPSLIFSIIPNTYYAKKVAEKAHRMGFQVMIHLPMQNKPGVSRSLYETELLINMSEQEIRKRFNEAYEIIAYADGVNNHTGSVFTLKPEPVRMLAKVLKEKRLFFVDSLVVSKSVAYDVMKEEGVVAYKRDLFLDHDYSLSKIKERIRELKSIAKKKGHAVGIGHFRNLTIQALKEEIPNFENDGIKLVHLGRNGNY